MMSNALAIATVTATLRQLLQAGISADVPGVTVKTSRPTATSDTQTAPEVDIFLYQVLPNKGYCNHDLPTRDAKGNLVTQPQVALDLYYLISCLGDETQIIPQRLLGSVVRTLNSTPVLPRQMITDTINNPAFSYLETSDLANQVEAIKFTPLTYTLDEFSRVWSVFYQIPYVLTVGYLATVVLIDSGPAPVPAPAVQQRNLYTQAFVSEKIQPASAVAIDKLTLNKNKNGKTQISGEIIITKAIDETSIDYYALYWGSNAFDKQYRITILTKTGTDLSYNLPSKSILPDDVNYLIVVTGNSREEMSYGVTSLVSNQKDESKNSI